MLIKLYDRRQTAQDMFAVISVIMHFCAAGKPLQLFAEMEQIHFNYLKTNRLKTQKRKSLFLGCIVLKQTCFDLVESMILPSMVITVTYFLVPCTSKIGFSTSEKRHDRTGH